MPPTYDDAGNEELDEAIESLEEETVSRETAPPPRAAAKKTMKRVGKPAPKGVAASPASPPPAATPDAVPWPTDGEQLWDAIVAASAIGSLTSYGAVRAADWKIDVTRTGSGPMPSPAVKMQSIDGAAVGGSEQRTPGEMLYDYIAELYHPIAPGAAKYDLQFVVKRRAAFKRGSIELPAPTELAQQRARVAQHAQQLAAGATGQLGMQMPPRAVYPQGMGAPPQQFPSGGYQPQPQQQSYPYPAAPDNGTRDSVDAMRREVAMLLGRIDEADRARAAGLGAPSPVVAPVAPTEDLDTRIARVLITTLGALGIGPAQRQPQVQPQQAVGVGAPTNPPGIGTVVGAAREHMSGLKEIMGIMKEFRELDQGFRPPVAEAEEEDEPTPIAAVPAVIEDAHAFKVKPIPFSESPLNAGKQIMWVERSDGESTTEWLTRMGAANPDAALNILQVGMKLLDQMSIGQILKQWMERGGNMGQAAQVVAAQSNGAATGPMGMAGVAGGPASNGNPYPPA